MLQEFIIFRRKIQIQQNLIKQYLKNIYKVGQIDIVNVFNYEK